MQSSDSPNLSSAKRSLEELIDLTEWSKIQDNFAAITGIGIKILNTKCQPVIKPSGVPRLCSELVVDLALRERMCGRCLPSFLGGTWSVDKNLSYACHSGLNTFVTPLRVENEVVGYALIGPLILVARKPKEQYRQAAEELHLDLENFWSALCEVKVTSFHSAQSLVELIKDVFDYLLKLSHQNKLMQSEIESLDSPKLARLLHALLDVAFQVSGADMGSIMLLDKTRSELTIKASRGLSEDVVMSTKAKLGEGIAGLAAKEGESFILDDATKDNRIKKYLTRPQIKSSMVVPLKVEDKVIGVMNLGALGSSSAFDIDSLKLMHKLIGLATVAFHD